jgi:hypothetical protein
MLRLDELGQLIRERRENGPLVDYVIGNVTSHATGNAASDCIRDGSAKGAVSCTDKVSDGTSKAYALGQSLFDNVDFTPEWHEGQI